ncbi:MAG: PAS domain-containing protein [Burkholderiales bacterium]|nr:PAS domain-containing protein [Anaerolineae bacterium]
MLQYILFKAVLVVAAVVAVALAFFAWRRRSTSGSMAFMLLMIATCIYALGYRFEMDFLTLPEKLIWAQVQYLGIVILPGSWFVFGLQYSGRITRLSRRMLALLCIEPIIVLALVWTYPASNLIWHSLALIEEETITLFTPTYGPLLWVHAAYSYALILTSTILLARMALRSASLYRVQAVALLIGSVIPWIGNAIYVFDFSPVDLSPITFALSGLAFVWGVFQANLLDMVPVAHDAVVRNLRDGVIVVDGHDRVILINPTAQRMFERRAADMVGQKITDFLTDTPQLVEQFRHVMEIKTEISIPVRGEKRWFLLDIAPLLDKQGRLTGRLIVVRDITENKHTSEALSQERNLLRTLIDNVPDYVYIRDANGRYILSNSAHWRDLRVSRAEDIIGKTPHDFFTPEVAERYLAEDQQVIISQIPIVNEDRAGTTTDGRQPTYTMSKVPLKDHSGAVIGVLVIARDITEHIRAERALAEERTLLRTLIDNSPDYIFIKDLNGRFIISNIAHAQAVKISNPEDLVGKTAQELFPPEYAAQFDADDQKVLSSGEPAINLERLTIDMHGNPRWVLTNKIPLRDSTGKLTGLVGTSRDISERKQVEEELRRFTAELERSNHDLQDFAHEASHDLKAPLLTIQSLGSRLSTRYASQLDDEGRDFLERMTRAAKRMQALISDLMTLSNVTTQGKAFIPVDLNVVAHDAISDLEAQIDALGGQVNVGTLPTINADPTLMGQLLQNLIGNALKYHRPNVAPIVHIKAEIGVGISDSGADFCQIKVSDNGIGFEQQYAERIFSAFQRLHGRSEYEGTGIGLAICRRIVERHGGTITAQGESGVGATFIVILPLR